MTALVLYIAGAYKAPTFTETDRHIARARGVAAAVWRAGHAAICPHMNTAHFDRFVPDIPDEAYLAGYLDVLDRCDGVVVVPGSEDSGGTRDEIDRAHTQGKPVWYYPDLPPVAPDREEG